MNISFIDLCLIIQRLLGSSVHKYFTVTKQWVQMLTSKRLELIFNENLFEHRWQILILNL